MKVDTVKRAGAGAAIFVALAGCAGTVTPDSDVSLRTPDIFLGNVSGTQMSGTYNPDKFTTEEVLGLLAATCDDGSLAGFTTQAREGILLDFSATCNAWADNAFQIQYLRSAGSNFIIKISGRAVKNLSVTQREVSL